MRIAFFIFLFPLSFFCQNAKAELIINEKIEYHDVHEAVPEKLAMSTVKVMKRICNKHALTLSCMQSGSRMRFNLIETQKNKCKVDALTITLSITYHLPKWVNVNDTSKETADRWYKILSELDAHEKYHGEIIKKHEKIAYEKISKLETHCLALERRAVKLLKKAGKNADKDHLKFDRNDPPQRFKITPSKQ